MVGYVDTNVRVGKGSSPLSLNNYRVMIRETLSQPYERRLVHHPKMEPKQCRMAMEGLGDRGCVALGCARDY